MKRTLGTMSLLALVESVLEDLADPMLDSQRLKQGASFVLNYRIGVGDQLLSPQEAELRIAELEDSSDEAEVHERMGLSSQLKMYRGDIENGIRLSLQMGEPTRALLLAVPWCEGDVAAAQKFVRDTAEAVWAGWRGRRGRRQLEGFLPAMARMLFDPFGPPG